MNILSRSEFIEIMKTKFDDVNDDHSIWEPEKYNFRNDASPRQIKSSLFVVVKPLRLTYDDSGNSQIREFWEWCDKTLNSTLRCYYSDSENQEEYWGFSGDKLNLKNDILIWLLKWSI